MPYSSQFRWHMRPPIIRRILFMMVRKIAVVAGALSFVAGLAGWVIGVVILGTHTNGSPEATHYVAGPFADVVMITFAFFAGAVALLVHDKVMFAKLGECSEKGFNAYLVGGEVFRRFYQEVMQWAPGRCDDNYWRAKDALRAYEDQIVTVVTLQQMHRDKLRDLKRNFERAEYFRRWTHRVVRYYGPVTALFRKCRRIDVATA